MWVRFREVVEIGITRYRPGDTADIETLTARSLVELKAAGYVHPAPALQVPAASPAPPPVKPDAPAGRVMQESGTLPAPEKRKGGLFGRKRTG